MVGRIALAALLVVGCSTDEAAPAASDAAAPADTADGALTLANCATSIAADAPEFFKRYFRCVTITVTDTAVVIASEGLPPHKSNYWPNSSPNWEPFDTSRGAMYLENPNKLQSQGMRFTIPKAPVAKPLTINASLVDGVVGTHGEEYGLGPVGVALDSVAMFNPLAAPGDDIEDEKYTFDRYNAHPEMRGAYHYHTASAGPLEVLKSIGAISNTTPGSAELEVYGILCDGTVVLGCRELDGAAPSATLDAQGGHVHDLTDGAGVKLLVDRYHTHVCPSAAGGRRFTPEIQYYTTCQRG